MSDNYFDDGYEARRIIPRDNDAALAAAVEEEKRTTPEQHEAADENGRRYLDGEVSGQVVNLSGGIYTTEDEELGKKADALAREAEERAAAQATGQANPQASEQAPAGSPADSAHDAAGAPAGGSAEASSTDGAGNADDPTKPKAEKPTELESTLANIRQNGERQQRIVISGDKDIERRFLDELAARKQLHYVGGAPVITISHKKALELLEKIAREKSPDTQFHHALSLSMERERGGFFHSIAATLGKRHQVDVVVVGAQDVVDAKMKELGSFVTQLEKSGHVEPGKAVIQDGKLVVENGQPTTLHGTVELTKVLHEVKDKVSAYKRDAQERKETIQEHRDAEKLKEIEEANAKAAPASGKTTPEKPHERTAGIVERMDLAFQDGGKMLAEKTDGKQANAMASLHQARGFTDPVGRELQTLPDGARQKAIVQLAAIVAKADGGEFGPSAIKELDKTTAEKPISPRDKVDAYIAMESKHDPEFAAKAAPLLKEMVDNGILSEKQADAISARVAEATEKAKPAPEKENASGDATSAAPAAAEGAKAAAQETTQAASSESQATSGANPAEATGKSASAADVVHAEAAADAKPAATQSTSPEAEQAKTGEAANTASEAAVKSPEATNVAAAQAPARETAESQAVAAEQQVGEQKSEKASHSESKTQGVDNSSALAADSSSVSKAESTSQAASSVEPKAESAVHAESATPAAREQVVESKPAATEKPLELRDRIEALAADGPSKLTADKAHALVSELDGIRSKPLSALDAGDGNKPTQTLARAESLLKEMESGRLGAELKAQAKDLAEPLQKWVQQDDARRDAAAQATRGDAQAATAQPAQQTATPTAPQAAASQAESAPRPATPEAAAVPAQPSAEQLAREQAAVRLTQTEAAYSKLVTMMDNPPGTFTHRDKSWNEAAIQRAADAVLRLDPDSVAKLSPEQQNRVAGYAGWVAEKAESGRLPGFASEEGQARVTRMVETAATLLKRLDGPLAPAVADKLTLADEMLVARETLDKQNARSSSPTHDRATDMVRQVFGPNEVSVANVKNMVKNGSSFTPAAVAELDPQLRAKTVAALEHLAQSVRSGDLGTQFNKLPNDLQKAVQNTEKTVSALVQSLDPATKEALTAARAELRGEQSSGNAADAKAPSKQAAQDTSVDRSENTPSAGKSGGRGLDR